MKTQGEEGCHVTGGSSLQVKHCLPRTCRHTCLWKRPERPSSRAMRGVALQTLEFQTSGLQTMRKYISALLNHASAGNLLWQPQKANIIYHGLKINTYFQNIMPVQALTMMPSYHAVSDSGSLT